MIRVVIDTNVIVSATLRSGGLPEAVLGVAVAGDVLFFVSEPVLAEYEEVLRRPRFAIERDKLSNAIARIRSASLLVHPETRVTAALDPDDNIFLECAQAADADYLITGNIKHFPATWRKTQIVTQGSSWRRPASRGRYLCHDDSSVIGDPRGRSGGILDQLRP